MATRYTCRRSACGHRFWLNDGEDIGHCPGCGYPLDAKVEPFPGFTHDGITDELSGLKLDTLDFPHNPESASAVREGGLVMTERFDKMRAEIMADPVRRADVDLHKQLIYLGERKHKKWTKKRAKRAKKIMGTGAAELSPLDPSHWDDLAVSPVVQTFGMASTPMGPPSPLVLKHIEHRERRRRFEGVALYAFNHFEGMRHCWACGDLHLRPEDCPEIELGKRYYDRER